MRGRKRLAVRVADQEVMHEFWLAVIRDSCIIGLDLLTRWGVRVDMAGAAFTVGVETVELQSGWGGHEGSGGQRSSRQVVPGGARRRRTRSARWLPGGCSSPRPVHGRHRPSW
jgi:hypothetical protein